jgi:hypothetical protein
MIFTAQSHFHKIVLQFLYTLSTRLQKKTLNPRLSMDQSPGTTVHEGPWPLLQRSPILPYPRSASSSLEVQALPDTRWHHPTISFSACQVFSCPQDADKESSWELCPPHPHHMIQVLQPPLFNFRYKLKLPSFVLFRHSPCSQTAPQILRSTFLSTLEAGSCHTLWGSTFRIHTAPLDE